MKRVKSSIKNISQIFDPSSRFDFTTFTLGGSIPEEVPSFPLPFVKVEFPKTLWELQKVFLYLEDSEFRGVVITVKTLNAGFSRVNELRRSILRLRERGKVVYVYLESPGNLEYFLASAANYIAVSPMSTLNLTGLSIQAVFARKLLDKLDIKPEIEGVGEYKSSAESLTRESMSQHHREMVEALLDDQFKKVVASISKERKIAEDKLISYIDNAPFTPAKALSLGLIDFVCHFEELIDVVKEKENLNTPLMKEKDLYRYLSFSSKYEAVKHRLKNKKGFVGLITIAGIITLGKSRSGSSAVTTAGCDTIIETIERAASDSSIRAIMIRVLSPGGSAVASDMIRAKISDVSKRKPVYISMSDVAASGGYLLSLSATKIFSDPFSITGSIGVISGKVNLQGFLNKIGINSEIVNRGKKASMFSAVRGFTPEEREKFLELINEIYENFVKIVAENRHLDEKEVDKVSRGRVWSGSQAVKLKLTDREGGLLEALKELGKELGMEDEVYKRVKVLIPERKIPLENLGRFLGTYRSSFYSGYLSEIETDPILAILPVWYVFR